MKKMRSQKPVVPISLSSKRGSLNHDQLFTPYKIDWKGQPPLQSMDTNTSKNFFQTMKSELSTIKNDFEKLIKKESASKSQREDSLKPPGYVKSKCHSVYKKNQKAQSNNEFERTGEELKTAIALNQRERQKQHTSLNSILALEKNLPCTLTFDISMNREKPKEMHQVPFQRLELSKDIRNTTKMDTSEEILLSREEESSTIRGHRAQSRHEQQKRQIIEQQLAQLREELTILTNQCGIRRKESEKMNFEKNKLLIKLEEYENQVRNKNQTISSLQEQFKQLEGEIEHQKQEKNNLSQILLNFQNQKTFLIGKIDEISYHHQNALNVNDQIAIENQNLRSNIFGLQKFIEESKSRYMDMQQDYKKKIQYKQKQITEYQKREDMFAKQIQNLMQKLRTMNKFASSEHLIETLEKTTHQLRQTEDQKDQMGLEIERLKKEVHLERKIHEQLRQKIDAELKLNDYKQLGEQFESKINKSLQENYTLRNKIAHFEANVESLELQNKSLVQELKFYEKREQQRNDKRSLSASEWQQIMEQNDRLKEQNKKLLDKYEFELMKKSSQQEEKPCQKDDEFSRQNFNKILKEQITEIQELKSTIKQNTILIQQLKFEIQSIQKQLNKTKGMLQIEKLKSVQISDQAITAQIKKLSDRQQKLYSSINQKDAQLRNFTEFISKVIIEKINKSEDTEDIDYYLKQLDSIMTKVK